MKIIFLSLLLLFLLFSVRTASGAPQFSQRESYAPEEIIVEFRPLVPEAIAEKITQNVGAKIKTKLFLPQTFVLKVPGGQEENLAKILSQNPLISYAEPNFEAQALEIPNDPYFSSQWGLTKIQAPGSWDVTHSSQSAKIAILDTGIDRDHEDLSSKIVARINFTDTSSDDDLYGHGTHVAGIASAQTANGIGVAGLGYDAGLISVKVLNDSGSGYYSWIANGIIWATDNGVRVINMSLGGSSSSSTLKNAIDYAWSKGVVLTCAAGNSGNTSPTYPGYYPNCIAVAATDSNDQKASWSSYGDWVDVAAPGVNILSTFPNHPYSIGKNLNYDYGSGTSMATPYVAGLASLLLGYNSGLTNNQVRRAIETYADDIAGTGNYWSQGRINAYRSLSSFLTTPTPTPTLTITPTPTPTPPLNEFAATITSHTASDRWSNFFKGRIDLSLSFRVDSGNSNQIKVKEITDQVGDWGLYRDSTTADVYINGVRYRTNATWDDVNEVVIVDIGSLRTLSVGDNVQVRIKLGNNLRGNHTITGQVLNGATMIGENTVTFTL